LGIWDSTSWATATGVARVAAVPEAGQPPTLPKALLRRHALS
jgi:hypothetical protein